MAALPRPACQRVEPKVRTLFRNSWNEDMRAGALCWDRLHRKCKGRGDARPVEQQRQSPDSKASKGVLVMVCKASLQQESKPKRPMLAIPLALVEHVWNSGAKELYPPV